MTFILVFQTTVKFHHGMEIQYNYMFDVTIERFPDTCYAMQGLTKTKTKTKYRTYRIKKIVCFLSIILWIMFSTINMKDIGIPYRPFSRRPFFNAGPFNAGPFYADPYQRRWKN